MIGSKFPARYPFLGSEGGSLPKRHLGKWAIAAALLAAIAAWIAHELSVRAFDWHLFAGSFAGIRWSWVAAAIVILYGTYYGRALRWAVLLKPLKPKPDIGNILSATVVGFAAITLFGRPGEIVRPYLIAVKENVPLASQLAAWLLERIYDLLMALLVFGFALAKVSNSDVHVGPALTWVLAAGGRIVGLLCGLLFVILGLFRHFAEPMRRRLHAGLRVLPEAWYRRAEKLVDAFIQGVESTRSDSALLVLLGYSVLEWVLIAGCYWCVAQAFAGQLHFGVVDILIYMGFVAFGSVVQLPGIGGGMQVVSVIVLTELFGIRLEVAASFSLFIWAITFVVIVPAGLLVGLREGLNWRKLKQIGEEVSS